MKEFGLKESLTLNQHVKKSKNEVEHWDHYAQGNTYYFTLEDHEGDNIECVGGFIGDYREVNRDIIDDYLSHYPDIVALKIQFVNWNMAFVMLKSHPCSEITAYALIYWFFR